MIFNFPILTMELSAWSQRRRKHLWWHGCTVEPLYKEHLVPFDCSPSGLYSNVVFILRGNRSEIVVHHQEAKSLYYSKITSKQTSNINSSLSLSTAQVTGLFTRYPYTEILHWTPKSLQKEEECISSALVGWEGKRRAKEDHDALKLIFCSHILVACDS